MIITTQQYAAMRGISDAAVRKAIIKGHKLPGVTARKKFGRAHVLHVDEKKVKEFLTAKNG